MNRKQRRSAYAEASSLKKVSKNHPIARLERMVQRTKQRIAALEGVTNEEFTTAIKPSEQSGKPDQGS